MRCALDPHVMDARAGKGGIALQPVAVLAQRQFGRFAGDGEAYRRAVRALADIDLNGAKLVGVDLEPALRAIGGQAGNVARQPVDPLA